MGNIKTLPEFLFYSFGLEANIILFIMYSSGNFEFSINTCSSALSDESKSDLVELEGLGSALKGLIGLLSNNKTSSSF